MRTRRHNQKGNPPTPACGGVTWRVRQMASPFFFSFFLRVTNPVRGGAGGGEAQTHQRISGAFGASTSTPRGFDDARDVFQNGSRSARTCRRGLKETEDGLKTVQRAPRRSLEGLKKQNHRLWNCFSMICPFSLFRIEGASRDSRETPRTGPRLSKRAAKRPRGFPRWSQGS